MTDATPSHTIALKSRTCCSLSSSSSLRRNCRFESASQPSSRRRRATNFPTHRFSATVAMVASEGGARKGGGEGERERHHNCWASLHHNFTLQVGEGKISQERGPRSGSITGWTHGCRRASSRAHYDITLEERDMTKAVQPAKRTSAHRSGRFFERRQ